MGVSQFFTATVDERLPIFSDQIVKNSVYMSWLQEKGQVKLNQGGDGGSFQVRKSRSGLVRAIGDWSHGQARTANTGQKVSWDYAAYGSEIQVSRLQIKRNQNAGQTGKVYELFESQLNEQMQDFEEYLNEDIVSDGSQGSGDEASPMDGLVEMIDTDNTYLSIARASNSWWQSQTRAVTNNFLDDDDADGVVNGLVALRLCFLDVCKGGADDGKMPGKKLAGMKNKPDLIYSGQTSFANFCLSLQPQQQYTNGSKNDPGQEVAFFGIPWKWDTFASADRIDILTSKTIQLLVVGGTIIYRDNEDELGLAGNPRVSAVGLVSQLQHINTRPSLNGFVSNTD